MTDTPSLARMCGLDAADEIQAERFQRWIDSFSADDTQRLHRLRVKDFDAFFAQMKAKYGEPND